MKRLPNVGHGTYHLRRTSSDVFFKCLKHDGVHTIGFCGAPHALLSVHFVQVCGAFYEQYSSFKVASLLLVKIVRVTGLLAASVLRKD